MVYALVIILGLVFGSFLNVVIYRMPKNLSIISPGSHCTTCGKPVKFYDNIPVLSYIFLHGKCRFCKSKISIRYPVIELLTAGIILAIFAKFGISWYFLTYSVLVLFLVPISVIDFDKGLILNKLTILGCILGIFLVLIFQIETWKSMLAGAAAGGISALIVGLLGTLMFKKDSMGMGDVKMLILTGIYVGFPGVLLGFFYGIFAAALYIVVRMALKTLKIGETIPFGPFIAIGTLVHILFGKSIIAWYLGLF